VVFLAAAVVAFVLQDDDPHTDESSGAGALAFAVGMAATVIYLAIGPYLHSRRRKRELDQTKARLPRLLIAEPRSATTSEVERSQTRRNR
jgi:uncharacterized membrane protein YccC